MTTTEAQRLKEQGQTRSLANLSSEHRDAFDAILLPIAPGQTVHVNAVRDLMVLAGITPGSMGGLFAGAVTRGLLTPLVTTSGDEIRRKSDGTSAHRATCRVYERCL